MKKIKRYLKKQVRRNERRMTTKKAKKALGTVALTIATLMILGQVIGIARAAMEPTILTFENEPFSWDARNEEPDNSPEQGESTATDGDLVQGDLESRIRAMFPGQEGVAVAVAKSESGLNHKAHSWTDRMADGRPFSIGLMQINITVHKLAGTDCSKAFLGRDYKAKVVNEELYQECVKLAEDAEINLATAKGIWERSGKNFGKWGGYTNGSYLKHL